MIQIPGYNSATKDATDLLSPEQVMSMITNASSLRDKAVISVLYEGGFRIGELGNLLWTQVKFFEDHAAISTDFKTGKPRTIPLYNSMGYLKDLANQYPGDLNTPGSFVFHKKME